MNNDCNKPLTQENRKLNFNGCLFSYADNNRVVNANYHISDSAYKVWGFLLMRLKKEKPFIIKNEIRKENGN